MVWDAMVHIDEVLWKEEAFLAILAPIENARLMAAVVLARNSIEAHNLR
jgi:hypothetical protein